MAATAMPIKTIPVLIVTFLFMTTGVSMCALFVERITNVAILFAIIAHLFSAIMWVSIYRNHKKKTPVFGLSIALWVLVTVIGYGLGVGLPFFA